MHGRDSPGAVSACLLGKGGSTRYVQLVTTSLPLRIFLASPGDLSDERQVVLTTVEEHNRRRRTTSDVVFEVVGWEQVRGTALRPQAALNGPSATS